MFIVDASDKKADYGDKNLFYGGLKASEKVLVPF
jgi:hypothetical protein